MNKQEKQKLGKNFNLVISGWMIDDLDLTLNETLAYALIYSYYKAGKKLFAKTTYIEAVLQCSQSTALIALQGLVKKDYVIKSKESNSNCTSRCIYTINESKLPYTELLYSPEKKKQVKYSSERAQIYAKANLNRSQLRFSDEVF